MNRRYGYLGTAALLLAISCSDSSDTNGGNGGTTGDAAVTCGGASASILAGSCTYSASGMTTCAEDYYNHALSASELDVQKQACSSSGFTYSEAVPCPTADVACKCVDTSGSFKRVKFGYGTYADACGTCTGDCYSKQ